MDDQQEVLSYDAYRNKLRLLEYHGRICYEGRKPLPLPADAHPPLWLVRLAQAAIFGLVVGLLVTL